MPKKLTDKQISNIQKLWKSGKFKTKGALAKKLNIFSGLIAYWTSPASREKAKKRSLKYQNKRRAKGEAWDQKNPEKYRAYQRRYFNDRYKNDPEFRRMMITANQESQRRKRENANKSNTKK